MSIQIIEIFVQLREMLSGNNDLLNKIDGLEKHAGAQDKKIQEIFKYLQKLIQQQDQEPRKAIGYKRLNND